MTQQIYIEPDTQNDQEENPTVGSFLWELSRIIIIAFVLMVGFRVFVAEPFVVSGSSMVPNFYNKEYLVIDKVTYRFSEPTRGDVVVFKYPKDTSQFFIKRIIGLPGEKVQVNNGNVIIYNSEHPDGVTITEPYLSTNSSTFGENGLVSLGTDEFFVLGDNRLASSDSRVWGVLPKHDIIGQVFLRAFPLNSFGIPTFEDPQL